ncbi:MAG: tryptophan synthase subunit beta [Marinospirillum sp.]|uniref:tryptophan synthase subunit beta n=1 Tax=Marinospirillum sp. TaxID=2183934 RepID=UPI001A02511A|nr:tryptophan synthase subunit beta [Marinospirillum sp.]MBE0508577.1 tryptophan synthase subunit beta [Marinospirillum sp.]
MNQATDNSKKTTSALMLPDADGFFGPYGGQAVPPHLKTIMDDIAQAYLKIRETAEYQQELMDLYQHYVGRPSPIYFASRLTAACGGAKIYLKREDLNHTGAHKINHALGEALLAKHMGKTKVIAETGAGQHGVAMATACALVGLPCEIHMGAVDVAKEHPNVTKMKILGAKLISVETGTRTLKDAVDSAFEEYMKDPDHFFYAIGSVVGPHPFPMMVRDFQSIIGREARQQFPAMTGKLPDYVVACVGGGSNAMGLFSGFMDDESVKLVGVEPSGRGLGKGEHAATLTYGKPGTMHGFHSYMLQDEQGEPEPVYSIASGLDYPSVGPHHSYLKDLGRAEYHAVDDAACLDAFMKLSRLEGIIPALESAHAVAWVMQQAAALGSDVSVLINLSGRGDKDADFVAEKLSL